jgi:hypothetical protein
MMNNSREKTNNLGFGRLRFIIAIILLIAAGLKAHQLATTPIPPPVQGSLFTPLLVMLSHRWLLMIIVEAEILFALILFSGILRQLTWLVSLLCFIAFSAVTTMKWLSGESSCGCFGVVTVPPIIMGIIDLIIVILLVVFREPFKTGDFKLSTKVDKKLGFVILIWLSLAIPVFLAMNSLQQSSHPTLGIEFTSPDGKRMIQLEPENWVGKKFPLTSRFEQTANYEMLLQGTWMIILIHTECQKCLQVISSMEKQNHKNIAIIEIPSDTVSPPIKTDFPYFKLDENNSWYITTPTIIKLSDGICVSASEP